MSHPWSQHIESSDCLYIAAEKEGVTTQIMVQKRGLRCASLHPTHAWRGAGQEDQGQGGREQSRPEYKVQDCWEEGGDSRRKAKKIKSMGWREMWPWTVLPMQGGGWRWLLERKCLLWSVVWRVWGGGVRVQGGDGQEWIHERSRASRSSPSQRWGGVGPLAPLSIFNEHHFLDTLASIGSILLSESQSVTESGSHVFEILSARLIFSRIGLKVF